ncbi:MAG: toll/interleukin-1 receptor domain-containing protein [Lachnospiraceae bacterium]|nr:toll/interleukin-1 receptor domain-containing protein [Lachnospiraceae bacterium]
MIFISYSSDDLECAEELCKYLEESGCKCWMAPRNIVPGQTYPGQLISAIRESDGVVLVASNSINESNHVSSEVASAFDMNKKIFPVLIEPMEFSDDYHYYLDRFQWVNLKKDKQASLNSLSDACLMEERINRANEETRFELNTKSSSDVKIANYKDLLSVGYDAYRVAERLVENDLKLYPDIPEENEGTANQWAEYLSSYPETFRYLINEKNEIVGNWSFLAVSEEYHAKKLMSGELVEASFSTDETEFLMFPGDYVGYLLNFSINEGYNSAKNIQLLFKEFTSQLLKYAEDGIFFKKWFVNVFRRDHEAMYKKMGFSFFVDNIMYGKLFALDCFPFPEKSPFKTNSELVRRYDEHTV